MMVEASIVNLAELVVLIIGVILALQQLRDIKETRQAELFSVLMERMDTVEFWRHYLNIRDSDSWTLDEWEEMVRDDPSIYGGLMSIVMVLQHVGWLVKKGLISFEVVSENMSIVVIRVHENTLPLFEEYGKKTGRVQTFSNLKYLYDRVKEHRSDLK